MTSAFESVFVVGNNECMESMEVTVSTGGVVVGSLVNDDVVGGGIGSVLLLEDDSF